ncbi:MAG: Bax inhibitor-1/YccA family protein [Alphaproteobacteria bacterium]|nr:Bax inhibitor-1/YccA family protein [Alphaproteobacteria bacterium]
MNDYSPQARSIPMGRADMAVDAGLRAFMVGVFNKMAVGLVLSGVLAYVVGNVDPVRQLFFVETARGYAPTILGLAAMFSPLVLLLIVPFAMRNPSPAGTSAVYWAVVSLMGIGLGSVFLRYTDGSIATTFFATASAYGALSLWGYTTKKDLTGFGSFLIMGVIGLVVASLVNIFLQSPALHFAVSAIGVLVFAGLTAFDTQRLKYTYYELGGDARAMAVATNFGALTMYMNFINLFQFLLSFLGNRE